MIVLLRLLFLSDAMRSGHTRKYAFLTLLATLDAVLESLVTPAPRYFRHTHSISADTEVLSLGQLCRSRIGTLTSIFQYAAIEKPKNLPSCLFPYHNVKLLFG